MNGPAADIAGIPGANALPSSQNNDDFLKSKPAIYVSSQKVRATKMHIARADRNSLRSYGKPL
jgi:hypothetical protein